jgi:hypothetical protein
MMIIKAHGTREGVLKKLEAAKTDSDKPELAEAVKSAARVQIASLPEKFNGCVLDLVVSETDGQFNCNVRGTVLAV